MRWHKLLILTLALLLWSNASFAQSVVSTHDYSSRCVPLGNTVVSTVFDVDATCAASALGDQAFNSLELTPADGSTVESMLFDVGSSNSVAADDPTLTGTVGTTGAYYLVDGADFFELNAAAASMATLFKSMHKTTGAQNFWIGWTFYHQTSAATKGLWSTSGSTATQGVFVNINTSEQLVFQQRGSSALVTSTLTSPTLVNNTWYTVLVSYSTAGNVRFWVNTTTANATQAIAFNASSLDATTSARIFSSAASRATNGMRLRWAGGGNSYIDNTEAAKIFSALELRHNTDYTP